MRRRLGLLVAAAAASLLLATASTPAATGWSGAVRVTNQVASAPFTGGGYPVPAGATAPLAGTCRPGLYNSNRSESWLAVQPGTENLVGTSKVFFETFSTFYIFHLGSYTIVNGRPAGNTIVQGYECVSLGTQAMPPSWMNNTDPNVDFDTQGRAYQLTLPFNPWWTNHLHPDAAIGLSYSDDLGRTWILGNGGRYIDRVPRQSSKTVGGVEDKQWIAVNHIPGHPYQDHVYGAWAVFNGFTVRVRFARSQDRGQTMSVLRDLTLPANQTGPAATYVYPAIDAAGTIYVAVAAFPPCCATPATLYVASSRDDGETWSPFVKVATVGVVPTGMLPNTTFRDGIVEHFAASPTFPGHVYLVWEEWDGAQMDIQFAQSTDGGVTWSEPLRVNDNANEPTDQFQPQIAAGPNGAVVVAFYDRRQACPDERGIIRAHVGRENFCLDVSLQAFKDDGAGAKPVGGVIRNVRINDLTWDPEQPDQTIDGIDQMACAAHENPCTRNAFIGDYFGLAVSARNIYALFVSTRYPSAVTADDGGPVYYQQQVLATVPRAAFGRGY
ncbi:MAG TPA: sialidase family protein [bacterium]|nr:sialidase family protein [bacterium]